MLVLFQLEMIQVENHFMWCMQTVHHHLLKSQINWFTILLTLNLYYVYLFQFTETVEDIISDLQTTQEAVVTAPPIAAKPGQLREQLEANRAIIDTMDRKLADLEVVKQDAEKMIEEAGGVEDESVQGTMNMIGESSVTCLLIG